MHLLPALKRHPIPMATEFGHCLVLTYALPSAVLEPLLPPGLTLDRYEDLGFVAVALVQTHRMRPSFLPATFGLDFFLAGYRIFTRYQTTGGRNLRGLRILRSETDRPLMMRAGNLLTHYNYHLVLVSQIETPQSLAITIRDRQGALRLQVCADWGDLPAPLPDGSPFPDAKAARRYAGPLPFTFDYERETHSIVRIQGIRSKWDPKPVHVQIEKIAFLEEGPFVGTKPILASAFHVADIPYHWKRGIREPLPGLALV